MTVMDEVTTHIAEVFTQAFNTVNEHYERIFGILFPGGEGRLELSDPDDILNSGVDIYARPAGKKVKRLSLLSGGERSLASLALLIAIFMASPSPFYALDEVEAALDDRNLGRVLTVLQELGERSQLHRGNPPKTYDADCTNPLRRFDAQRRFDCNLTKYG